MGTFSKVLTLRFSDDDKWGFEVTLGDLAKFVDHARASGAEDSDVIFPELERDTEIVGMSIHVDPVVS